MYLEWHLSSTNKKRYDLGLSIVSKQVSVIEQLQDM